MNFGARLAEERKRLGLKQAEFAGLVGTDVAKQSLYETGRRDLRAPYLARLADAQVDVLYVLTGERSQGDWLAQDASALLSAYVGLPDELRQVVLSLVRALRAQMGPGQATVHTPRSGYRPPGAD